MDATDRREIDINTLPDNGFRLVTLGTLALVDDRGIRDQSLAKRRRTLALLAVLALSRRAVARQHLAEMLWGDEEEAGARRSLSDALANLRSVLGPDSIVTRLLEVELSPTCPLVVDAVELIEAAERRDHARVVALYAGGFMDSINFPSAPSFDRWTTRIREQLHRHWLDACSAQCLSLARGRKWVECAILARRWLDADPMNPDAALYVLNALKAPATSDSYRSALDEFALLEQRLDRELEATPAPEVVQLAASIRDELARMPAVLVPVPAVPPPVVAAIANPTAGERVTGGLLSRFAHSRFGSMSFAAVLFLGATSFTARPAASRPAYETGVRTSVAVVGIRNLAGDSASAWLELGIPRMVASGLARVSGIEVISPERVRSARLALGIRGGAALTRSDVVRLGARSGARWVVSGGITRGDSLYVLDVTVQDTAGITAPSFFTVTSPSLVALADEAAAKLAGLATTHGTAPVFAR